VLFAAAAIGSGVSFLPDVSDVEAPGNLMGLNKTMLTPRNWLGWPSPNFFWPLLGQPNSQGGPHLVEADGSAVQCDFHNIKDWKTLRLGPYHPNSGVDMDSEADAFFAETLAQAQAYKRLVVCDPAVMYPPIAVLNSDAEPTITSFRREGIDQPFNMLQGFATTPGDGRVALSDAHPPPGVPVLRTITNSRSHSEVLSDLSHVHELLNDLLEEATRRGQTAGSRRKSTSQTVSRMGTPASFHTVSRMGTPPSILTPRS